MTATLLKFLHIAAISVWVAGLICFPFLNRQLTEVHTRTELNRLHSMARFFYVLLLSPAAFVAIATGTALIFQQQTFTLWFSIKLVFVGLLAVMHLLTGRMLLRTFDRKAPIAPWCYVAMTTATTAIAGVIVTVVLIKPDVQWQPSQGLFKPGGLKDAYERALLPALDHQAHAVVEDQLATMPTSQTGEDGCQHGQRQPMGQHLIGRCQPQPPIGASDGEQHHGCNGMRPAAHTIADAFHCEQFGSADQGRQHAQAKGEARTPDAGAQKERIALKPVEQIDAQRGED